MSDRMCGRYDLSSSHGLQQFSEAHKTGDNSFA